MICRSVPTLIPEPEAQSADLLGTILAGQTRLMMSGSDVVINRDGSLTAKKAGENFSAFLECMCIPLALGLCQ